MDGAWQQGCLIDRGTAAAETDLEVRTGAGLDGERTHPSDGRLQCKMPQIRLDTLPKVAKGIRRRRDGNENGASRHPGGRVGVRGHPSARRGSLPLHFTLDLQRQIEVCTRAAVRREACGRLPAVGRMNHTTGKSAKDLCKSSEKRGTGLTGVRRGKGKWSVRVDGISPSPRGKAWRRLRGRCGQ